MVAAQGGHPPDRHPADGLEAVRMIAEAVPDPELVVVTVGDLGIVRDIRTDAAGVEIDVTPTYSACPATLAIELAIRRRSPPPGTR